MFGLEQTTHQALAAKRLIMDLALADGVGARDVDHKFVDIVDLCNRQVRVVLYCATPGRHIISAGMQYCSDALADKAFSVHIV